MVDGEPEWVVAAVPSTELPVEVVMQAVGDTKIDSVWV